MPTRFIIDRQPYDEDRTEMVCTDLLTGESYDLPEYRGWQLKMREWMESQVKKHPMTNGSDPSRNEAISGDAGFVATVDAPPLLGDQSIVIRGVESCG